MFILLLARLLLEAQIISSLVSSDHSIPSGQAEAAPISLPLPHVSIDGAAYSDKCSRTSSRTGRDRLGSDRQSDRSRDSLGSLENSHTVGASHQPVRHGANATPLNAPSLCPACLLPQQVHYPRRQTDCGLRLEDHRGPHED